MVEFPLVDFHRGFVGGLLNNKGSRGHGKEVGGYHHHIATSSHHLVMGLNGSKTTVGRGEWTQRKIHI